ncbi:MAG: OmpH family outer membrane protein [Phycisphaerales bacterium]|nr:OmpH family outer membrane protein [Phycisphaerales bacterium]MCB9835807.1 OmpH family outer membrane protein [Phycisphaera sp.]
MNSNTRFVAVTLGITLVAAIAAALGAGVAQSRLAAPTTVAVIDIDRLSTSLEEFKVPREQFISKQNTWTEELKGLQTRLASLDEELELIPEDNMDARINKVIQRTTVESEIKTKSQLFQQASDLEQAKLFKRMYDKIEDGASRIAQRDGVDVVLVDDRIFKIPANNRAAQADLLNSKKVLYASESVDLTDELLTMLNNEFTAGK